MSFIDELIKNHAAIPVIIAILNIMFMAPVLHVSRVSCIFTEHLIELLQEVSYGGILATLFTFLLLLLSTLTGSNLRLQRE